jgi:acyl-CoA thioesterase-2
LAPVPDERHIQASVLAYISDMTLLDTRSMRTAPQCSTATCRWRASIMPCGSTARCRMDDWLLYTQDSPSAFGARGMTRGSLFDRSGTC